MDTTAFYSSDNKTYSKCRPHYPPELFHKIFNSIAAREVAIDVGTGTGQALEPLAQNFEHVVAVDRSKEQLAEAAKIPNVKYVVARAEHLVEDVQLKPNSVDLITVAAALHWLDLENFYSESRTVLKSGGCLAAFAYYLWSYPNNPAANAVLRELHDEILGPYLAPPIKHAQNKYIDLLPDEDQFEEVELFSFDVKMKMSVGRCAGLLSTFSGYKQYKASNGHVPDPLDAFSERTMAALGLEDPDEEFEVDWEFFGFIATKIDSF